MSMRGRRALPGMERTPSGAISRSKSNIAKRAEKIRDAQKDQERRAARLGRSLQERTQQARARVYGLTASQAASHHASTVEGRMHLRGVITSTELLALEHYRRVISRFARDAGTPMVKPGALAAYQPAEPRAIAAPASGAAASLSKRHYDRAEDALNAAGLVREIKVSWAVSRVIRHEAELPPHQLPAFLAGVAVLVALYDLGPDPDRDRQRAA